MIMMRRLQWPKGEPQRHKRRHVGANRTHTSVRNPAPNLQSTLKQGKALVLPWMLPGYAVAGKVCSVTRRPNM